MPATLLSVQSASKRFGDVIALESVDLDINQGDIIGLVGSNGAGKTTLLRLLSGVYRPTSDVHRHRLVHESVRDARVHVDP